MPPTTQVIPGFYLLQLVPPFDLPPLPKPRYLTSNGELKQLTLEEQITSNPSISNPSNQVWKILPPFTGNPENDASVDSDRIIIQPNKDSDFLAVSQDIVISPDKVFLTKNLQVWTFQQADSDQIYEIKSNLGRDDPRATFPLLGTDEDFKAIIQFFPIFPELATDRPLWKLIGPLEK